MKRLWVHLCLGDKKRVSKNGSVDKIEKAHTEKKCGEEKACESILPIF